ncbi:hypothetical protein LEP1GSC051_1397 [Leptospira sp. P2653]|nr:hypothetical protein LEP1GSC051_1397 [Leptospira sp. P2653]
MFEYRLRIPLKQENGSPWSDPRLRLDDERVDESYELIEGATYTFWGRVVGPTFFPILQFLSIGFSLISFSEFDRNSTAGK